MSVSIQWTEEAEEGGPRRFVKVERFAGVWSFQVKAGRRGDWQPLARPTREQWETLLEAIERRYTRREGVSDVDVAQLKRFLASYRERPADDRTREATESRSPTQSTESK